VTIENRAYAAPRDGYRRTGEEAEEVVEYGKESRDCGVESGDGPDDGAAVSGPRVIAQRTEERTRVADPRGSVGEVWDVVQRQIQESPGLEAKTLFEWLHREYPGRFSDGQIRRGVRFFV
jgi:hypothetical protein